jgi:hypothetical protein
VPQLPHEQLRWTGFEMGDTNRSGDERIRKILKKILNLSNPLFAPDQDEDQ